MRRCEKMTDEEFLHMVNNLPFECGVERITFIDRNCVHKISHFMEVGNNRFIPARYFIKKKAGGRTFRFVDESQTECELSNYRRYKDELDGYCAKLLSVKKWRGFYVTTWERLELITFPEYEIRYKAIVNDFYEQFSDDLKNTVQDIHYGNVGLDKEGNIKLLDLGN